MISRLSASLLLLALLPLASHAQPSPQVGGALGLYRYPTLHGDLIVFAAEGDLWRISTEGGVAQRLTTHPSEESDPVISPDGATLAFTARYEGPAEVYTMPLEGGLPVRRTYEAEPSIATTWTPDGRLVYTTSHYSTLPQNQLVALDLDEGTVERVPLYTATEGSFDAGGGLYFVRPAYHNNVTKRYRGGTARDIWKFEAGAGEAVELTGDYDGESHSPMCWNGRVYFVTDRDGTMNLWSMDESGGDLRQHTAHAGWDVKNPDLEEGRIVYQLGADLRLYDIRSGQDRGVSIALASDFDQLREKWVNDPMQYLTSAHLSPDGERIVLTARGRVFVAPAGDGRLVRASVKPGVRYRDATFLGDSDTVVALSDESGEFEWVTLPATGVGEGRALTEDGQVLRYEGAPSPDGRLVAYVDHWRDLWILDVASGRQRRINERREGVAQPAWSPDGRWLAFVEAAPNTFTQVRLFDTVEETVTVVTSDRVNSQSPAWGRNGEFLYLLSDRNLRSRVGSPWGSRQPEPYFDETWEIYEIALRAGLRSPFMPDDELAPSASSGGEDEETPVTVDLDGIQRRVRKVPAPAGNYGDLRAAADALFFLSRESGQFGGGNLTALPISSEDPEPVTVVEGVSSYEMSADGKKLLARQRDNLHVIDARPQRINDLADARVDLTGWAFPIDVREDWRQIYVDAWRMERDYFYDPGMHGLDWEAVRDKYLPLVDRVTTREELSDVIGRVIGELSALHTSVRGGDTRTGGDDVGVASLGARLSRDMTARGYRVDYIYASDPDYPDEMSPLADPYLDVREGDVITAVNGVAALSVDHIGALLRNQAGKQVRLAVRRPGGASRDVLVTPIADERSLRYSDWEYTRRTDVEEKGEGAIGYVHLRAMSSGNLTEWYRQFYPVFNRQGLIIDVRRNSGGNIDSFILEKLMRQAWMYWKENVGEPSWNMQYAFRGHMVVLVDQNTASDGEAFAEGFRRLGLGPVIGMRTWGGEIWLGSSNRLTDGGLARAPSMGVYGPEGEWLVEQIGVVPDIVVDNLPHATFQGEDAQLDAAIGYLQERIAEDPRAVPEPPPYPNRAFRYRATDGGGGRGERNR
ncbi:MAG: S41 family peptidase [Gemmatimonadota bacterium]